MSYAIQRFGRNPHGGRDLIVGDIHGCFTKLRAALAAIRFDGSRDRLFSVGDLVDRGPESDEATDWLKEPWFHAVAGNHEVAAVMFAAGKLPAAMYLGSFGGGWNISNPQAERQRIADAFAGLPLAIELETAAGLVAIVHADCPVDDWAKVHPILEEGGMRAQSLEDGMQWGRTRAERMDDGEVRGVRAVVVGHTPMERMTSLGNVLFIDTFAWRHGHFTIIDAHTLRSADAPSILDWSEA